MTPKTVQTSQTSKTESRSYEPRKKGDLRKAEIVEGFIRCLAKQGFHRTNYESLGAETGLKRAHVAYHFPDFQRLYFEALTVITQTGQDITIAGIRAATDPRERLEAVVGGAFTWAERHPEQLAVFTLLFHWGAFHPGLRAEYSRIRALGNERFQALLSEVRPELTPPQAARLAQSTQAILTGFLAVLAGTTDFGGAAEAQAQALGAIHRLIQI